MNEKTLFLKKQCFHVIQFSHLWSYNEFSYVAYENVTNLSYLPDSDPRSPPSGIKPNFNWNYSYEYFENIKLTHLFEYITNQWKDITMHM